MGIRRIHGLVTEPIDNELLIFNQATGEGHAVNEPAASLPIIEPMPAPQASRNRVGTGSDQVNILILCPFTREKAPFFGLRAAFRCGNVGMKRGTPVALVAMTGVGRRCGK